MVSSRTPAKDATGGTVPGPAQGSALCMQCGLCCTGVVHDNAVLEAEEVAGALGRGLPVLPGDKKLFSLPCPALAGTTCSIYRDRPGACRRYKCQVLLDLESGNLAFDQAVEKVSTAKRLVRAAREVMPPGMTLPQARRLATGPAPRESVEEASAPDRGKMELRLRTTALNLYIDQNFRNYRDRKSFVLTPVEDSEEETAK